MPVRGSGRVNPAFSYAAGGLWTLSPCVLPLLPIVLFGVLEKHTWGPVALAAGLATSFALLGTLIASVGFNIGLGYRWMNYPPYAASSGRMDGISLWADGTHTNAGNFFPQVGVSYESLVETWDVQPNGYIPTGGNDQVGPLKPTNVTGS